MKNCELAVGIIVGVLIGKACQDLKRKHPIKPDLPCKCEDCCRPPKKPNCDKCYYQIYKRC